MLSLIIICVTVWSYTRVYLQFSNNNRAITHLSLFVKAVQTYGLPERVHSDLGGENVNIWRYMVEQHGSNTLHSQ